MTIEATSAVPVRRRLVVCGLVQGVGFRPFVYATARDLDLAGDVANTPAGVVIEIEGPPDRLDVFAEQLRRDAPPLAVVDDIAIGDVPAVGGTDFVIADSRGGSGRTLVPPDIATCDACLAELADPADRRYRHPFISCTNCGPRFTIVVDLPYDRPATTMAGLPLCLACATEYAEPADRRFHAQTVACPDCGPTLTLVQPGQPDLVGGEAVIMARRLLGNGAILAAKGLGGWHLACDADDEQAVATLRKRKDRGDKPFAVMVADLDTADELAVVSARERALLSDPRRPVVLLRSRSALAPSVAPGHPDLGVVLPYTPVHHLLRGLPGDPSGPRALVVTSGNLAGEPIATADGEARTRLASLADAWLGHDRPIHVPCDDSVALPFPVRPALAVGGDLKNTFCLGEGRYAWLSAHVGDMDDLATQSAFATATAQLAAITGVRPEILVTDRHPGYRSAAWARAHAAATTGLQVRTVQHHHAHIASAMAENGYDSQVIGVAFDGTGYGEDGAVWGGEVLLADYDGFTRAAHLAYVALPGGDAAVRNPYRMALSHLRSAGVDWNPRLPSVAACPAVERKVLDRQLSTGLGCTPTSSMGRLFDAMSSLAGVCHRVAYEAEAAMRFEALARDAVEHVTGYPFALLEGAPLRIDAGPVLRAAAADVLAGVECAVVAARFHIAVADLVLVLAQRLRARVGLGTVALSGGVFLNVLLTTLCQDRLQDSGFQVLSHHRVPPSDAGVALGQLAVGARQTTPLTRDDRSAICA